MENIAQFLSGAKDLGVPPHDLFQTVDLFEKKNMTQVLRFFFLSYDLDARAKPIAIKVVNTIFAVSRYAHEAGACSSVSRTRSLNRDIKLSID